MAEEQRSLEGSKKSAGWKLIEPPKDESFTKLDVGEELEALFVGSKENFRGNLYYIFEDEQGNPVKLNDTANLHKSMELVEPGDFIRIKHVKNIPQKPPRNPLEIYKVWKKES